MSEMHLNGIVTKGYENEPRLQPPRKQTQTKAICANSTSGGGVFTENDMRPGRARNEIALIGFDFSGAHSR